MEKTCRGLGGIEGAELPGFLDFDRVSFEGGGNLLEEVRCLLHDKDLDTRLPQG